jgi:hypothetical protein
MEVLIKAPNRRDLFLTKRICIKEASITPMIFLFQLTPEGDD